MQANPNMDSFHPKDCISRKIMKCHRIIAKIFRKHLLQFNITNSQLSILFVASKWDFVTQSQLAEKLYLEKSTVSRNMRRLFEHKYLEKNESQQIHLTKEGQNLLKEIIPYWEKAMAETRAILEREGEDSLNLVLHQLSLSKK